MRLLSRSLVAARLVRYKAQPTFADLLTAARGPNVDLSALEALNSVENGDFGPLEPVGRQVFG